MSSGATHWCHACRQPIVLDGGDTLCPYCDGGFIEELDELRGAAPHHTYSSQSGEFNQMPDLVDAIRAFMGQRGSDQRFGLMDAVDNFMRHRMAGRNSNFDVRGRSGSFPAPEQSWGVFSSGPYLIFHGQVPGFTLATGSPRGGPRRVDFGDYFMGPGLEELIEQLTMNDRRGPPPAARSLIDAMPTIRITQHNSCPVCRVELPPQGQTNSRSTSLGGRNAGTSSSGGNDSSSRGRENNSPQNHGRRNPLSFLWPFRSSSSSNNNHYSETGGSSSSTTPDQNNGTSYSGWPFDH